MGSGLMWFWLARIMRGNNQHVSTRSGVDSGSVPIYVLEKVQPVSVAQLIQCRLSRAISKLCRVVIVQSHFGVESQIVGNSMIVGIRIFSIVEG